MITFTFAIDKMKITFKIIVFYLVLYLTSAGIVNTCIKVWKNKTIDLVDISECEDDTEDEESKEENELKESKLFYDLKDFSLEQLIATNSCLWLLNEHNNLPSIYTEILSPPPKI